MKSILLILIILLTTLVSCEKRLKVDANATFTNITQTSADVTISGDITNSRKEFIWGFSYDTTAVMDIQDNIYSHPTKSRTADFTVTITGLSPSTTYYVRPHAEIDGIHHLEIDIFTFTTLD